MKSWTNGVSWFLQRVIPSRPRRTAMRHAHESRDEQRVPITLELAKERMVTRRREERVNERGGEPINHCLFALPRWVLRQSRWTRRIFTLSRASTVAVTTENTVFKSSVANVFEPASQPAFLAGVQNK